MQEIIGMIAVGLVALLCVVLGIMQLMEKGPLLNNSYTYASKSQKEKMNKKPLYRQSGVIFLLVGVMMGVVAVEIKLQSGWLFYVAMGLVGVTLAYAVVSSLIIVKNR